MSDDLASLGKVLALIREQPGITLERLKDELYVDDELDVDAFYLSRVLRRLRINGYIVERGGWYAQLG